MPAENFGPRPGGANCCMKRKIIKLIHLLSRFLNISILVLDISINIYNMVAWYDRKIKIEEINKNSFYKFEYLL